MCEVQKNLSLLGVLMPGLFGKFFGKIAQPKRREPTATDERVGVSLMLQIEKNLNALGFEFQQAPTTGSFVTPETRATLIGAAFGVLEGEGVERSEEKIKDAVLAAFVFAYGEKSGPELAMKTFYELQDRDPIVLRTSEWALEDMLGVYKSGGNTSFAAFMLAARGVI